MAVGGRMVAGRSRVRASGHLGRDGGRWFEGGEGGHRGRMKVGGARVRARGATGEWGLVGRR